MRRVLPLLFLVGCWPYLDEPWSTYDVPEGTQLYGRGYFTQPVGGYWESTAPVSSLFYGWLSTPQSYLHAYSPTETCTSGDLALDGPLPAFRFIEGPSGLNAPSGAVPAQWNTDFNVFTTELNLAPFPWGSTWSLSPTTVDGTPQSVTRFLRTPPTLDVTAPVFTATDAPVLPRSDVLFSWTVDTAKAPDIDHVQITLHAMDNNGNLIGTSMCWADYRDSELIFPASAILGLSTSAYAVVVVGNVKESEQAIDGALGASRVGVGNFLQGAIVWQ